jgi:hypothetical protein
MGNSRMNTSMQEMIAAIGRYSDFNDAFQRESDRGCAVLVMCAVEEICHEALERRLGVFAQRMLRQVAPPGAWEKLINSLELFGIASPKESAELDLMRRVRNKFAHQAEKDLTFDHPSVASLIDQMRLARIMWGPNLQRRPIFAMTASVLSMFIASRGFDGKQMEPCEEVGIWEQAHGSGLNVAGQAPP